MPASFEMGGNMQALNFKKQWFAIALLALTSVGASVQAATLSVHCGSANGLTSIGAALKALQSSEESQGPNTINVSGACHENILIKGIDLLTITGSPGASITDASGGAADVVDIRTSRVTITGMTIDGKNGVNNDAVDCEQASRCTLVGNTIQGDAEPVGVYPLSSALIVGGVLQNGTSDGLLAFGDVLAIGVQIQGNPVGVIVRQGGRVRVRVADPRSDPIQTVTPTTVANNGAGIEVGEGAQFACAGCVVEDNSGDGIHADVSAAVTIAPGFLADGSVLQPSVTRNTGYGVYLGDLSSGTFRGPAVTVTGNGQRDILCNSPTSVSRRALAAAGGAAHTNCVN
jgi:hypothetical protein